MVDFFAAGAARRGRDEDIRFWALGGPDPEMEMSEQLLRDAGERVAYASVGGVRVHAGNAYAADGATAEPELDCGGFAVGPVLTVECGFTPRHGCWGVRPVVIDHHRPGDPGFGRPPAEWWD